MAIILASTSPIRSKLLSSAGVNFQVRRPAVDETVLKRQHPHLSPKEMAGFLAREKSISLSAIYPGATIIGADQTLWCDGTLFDKPGSIAEAASQLSLLRGQTHTLTSAICCSLNATPVWEYTSEAQLTMRAFTDRFMRDYLETVAFEALSTVGSYKLEGPGIQLFENIVGDYFTILGLPLLPLLGYLRTAGELDS